MYKRIITDEEFLNSFQSFAFAARPAISFLLYEKLEQDASLKPNDIKAIILQIFENYYFESEMLMMIIEALHSKKESPNKSFVSLYSEIFIKEGAMGAFSKDLLSKISKINAVELVEYFGFKKIQDTLSEDSERMDHIISQFGNIDKAIEQFYIELNSLKDNIEKIISNRIMMKDGSEFPFFKLLNKLKHGYQVIEDEKEQILSILIKPVEEMKTEAVFEVIELPIKKETAAFFMKQTRIMADTIRHLLHLYIVFGIK